MINHFIHKHKDILEAIVVGGGGFSAMMANIELILKVLIGLTTLGFIVYKWVCVYKDRNKK